MAVATGTRSERPGDAAALTWVRAHLDGLPLAGGAVAVLLLAVEVNLLGLLLEAVVVGLYQLGLSRLRPPSTITLPDVHRV